MLLSRFLLQNSRLPLKRLAAMAAIASASNAGILAVVNHAAQHIKAQELRFFQVLLFGVALFAYIYSQRYVLLTTCDDVEEIVHRLRCRLVELLRRCDLVAIEQSEHGKLYAAICSDTQVLSQSACTIVLGIQSVILIVFASMYIAMLSMMSLILIIVVMAVATSIYVIKSKSVHEQLSRANEEEAKFHDRISGLLSGFKEVKLSGSRSRALSHEIQLISERTCDVRKQAQRGISVNFMFAQIAMFVVLGTMVFILPNFSPAYTDTVMKTLTAVLFLVGPISGIIAAIPQLAVATASLENLRAVEAHLALAAERRAHTEAPAVSEFKELRLQDICFQHFSKDGHGFSVGPINLTIRAGEVVFITGGNGSGKSTLIKLLTALYRPTSGTLMINGRLVTSDTIQMFRDSICAVFSDFHLFAKFYGIENWDPAEASDLLGKMELESKVQLEANGFSTTDLSSGQRKRLALISAILERKPICVLDEWAADQDPHFRRKFYHEVIPALRARGITLIAVTHDDAYFAVADRRLHMADGRLIELTSGGQHAPA